MKNSQLTNHRAYIALIGVLVVGAVLVSITISLLLLGVGSSRTTFALQQSSQARALADACAEEALRIILDSPPPYFVGSGSLSLGQGTCNYTVEDMGGENRTIKVTGTVETVVRKILITIDRIDPAINLTSWQEVSDF